MVVARAARSREPVVGSGVSAVFDRLGGDIDPALEQLGLPAAVLDQEGRIRYLNRRARQCFGDLRGHRFSELFAPEGQMRARRGFAKLRLGAERVTDEEQWLRTRDGVVRVEVHVVAVESGDRVVGVFGIASPPAAPASQRTGAVATALTSRQAEVLALLAAGRSTAQIADALSISTETVRNHIRGILRTLGVHSRLEAVVESIRLGLLAE